MLVLRGIVDRETRLAALGLVHGHVGPFHQRGAVTAMLGEQCDPETGAYAK